MVDDMTQHTLAERRVPGLEGINMISVNGEGSGIVEEEPKEYVLVVTGEGEKDVPKTAVKELQEAANYLQNSSGGQQKSGLELVIEQVPNVAAAIEFWTQHPLEVLVLLTHKPAVVGPERKELESIGWRLKYVQSVADYKNITGVIDVNTVRESDRSGKNIYRQVETIQPELLLQTVNLEAGDMRKIRRVMIGRLSKERLRSLASEYSQAIEGAVRTSAGYVLGGVLSEQVKNAFETLRGQQSKEEGSTATAVRDDLLREVAIFIGTYRLLTNIFTNYKLHSELGDSTYLDKASELAQELDNLLAELGRSRAKTIPVGLYHSAGSGFTVGLNEIAAVIAKVDPSTPLYGYSKLAPETARFSAETFQYLYKQRQIVEKQIFKQEVSKHPALEALVRHAFIPIPNPIDESTPVVGPIKLNDDAAALYLTWVRGPTLHDQLSGLGELAKSEGEVGEQFRDARLWTVSQMTGIWQALPPLLSMNLTESPQNLEQTLRDYYTTMLVGSLEGYATLLAGIQLTDVQKGKLEKTVAHIISQLPMSPENMGRYFDAALRNFIDEVGNLEGTHLDAFRLAVKNDRIDMSLLWNLTRRIDFSHVARRPYGVFEEDSSHITENWLVNATEQERQRYQAAIALSRKALTAFQAQDLDTAVDIAEAVEDVRTGKVKPEDVSHWTAYRQRHNATIEVMPWVRKVRQGYLALVYGSKAVYNQETLGEDLSGVLKELLMEAEAYASRSLGELQRVISLFGIRRGSELHEGMTIIGGVLAAAQEQAKSGNINAPNMMERGKLLLTTYV